MLALVSCASDPDDEVVELFEVRNDAFAEVAIELNDFRGIPMAVGNLVGDSLLDVVIGDRNGGLWLYENKGALQFTDVTETTGLGGMGSVDAIAIADLNGDGTNELLVAGGGTLVRYEVTAEGAIASVPTVIHGVQHLLPFDFDGDGILEVHATTNAYYQGSEDHLLFLRSGVLVFDPQFPVSHGGRSWTATVWDVDGDGSFDLHVANDTLASDFGDGPQNARDTPADLFYRGQQSATGAQLVSQPGAAGLGEPRSSMGGRLLDIEGGRTVLFVPDFGRNKAFEWTGHGFDSVGDEIGFARATFASPDCQDLLSYSCLLLSWGTAAADFDLDGQLELIVVNGIVNTPIPPMLWYEWRGHRFVELVAPTMTREAQTIIAADFDRDGDDDLLVAGRFGTPTLFENLSAEIKCPRQIYLRGTRSSREGRGAVVTTSYASGASLRHWVGSGGSAFSSASVEISTGRCDLESIEVVWPTGSISTVLAPDEGSIVLEEPL